MNIIRHDLNLFRLFLAISEDRNLSVASKRLGLSQPALSHALGRLRTELQDPLFVRASRGLVPTDLALELVPRVREALAATEAIYAPRKQFVPATVTRDFTLGATTYFELRVLDRLMAILEKEAPGITLRTLALSGEFPKEALERGELDLAVAAYFTDLPESIRVRTLGRDPHVCVLRKGNPYLRTRRTLEDFLRARHVRIAVPATAVSKLDQALAARGKKRAIVAHLGNFLTPPWVLTRTDCLLTCPKSLAQSYARALPLEIIPLPLKVAPIEIRMAWHERHHADPLQKWMRERIAKKGI